VRFTILLAAALTAGAAEKPFSHRVHLTLKLECTGCHSTASSSTRLQDNLLPQKAVCLKCHQDAAIGKPRASGVLTRFNHQLHLKLGNVAPVIARAIESGAYLSPPGDLRKHLNTANACTACHRGLEESDAVTNAALPRMADCLVCHGKIEPPFSCEYCHEPGPHLKPASHTADWVDRHSSGKANLDKPSCAVCHGRTFTCQGCH
jgi:predicted CXXCH cytochrome family protein